MTSARLKDFLKTKRVTKDLWEFEMTLEATGEVYKTIDDIREGLDRASSLVTGIFLDTHERTVYDEEYVHIGWVWEDEFEPFVEKREYIVEELGVDTDRFKDPSCVKDAWFDEAFGLSDDGSDDDDDKYHEYDGDEDEEEEEE